MISLALKYYAFEGAEFERVKVVVAINVAPEYSLKDPTRSPRSLPLAVPLAVYIVGPG